MPVLATMVVEYVADTTGLGTAVTALAAVGAATVAAGVAAVKMAGDFQAGLTNLQTAGGETADNLQMVGNGIKQIAIDTGSSTKDLLSAMVMIDSANMHGADSLNVLRIAAEGAKTDHADLTTVTMALTGVMTNFKIPASGAAGAMNELIAASKDGKMHLQDLSAALGPIGMVATNAGLSFADVSAAVAMMTNRNVSAQQASQNLAFAIRALDAPSGVAQKSLAAVGLSAQDVADTLRNQGLPAALQLIEDHVGKKFPASSVEWTTAMKNIMGGKAGLNVALALGGDNLKQYEKDVGDVAGALNRGGTSVEGWSDVQKTFNSQMDRARSTVEVLAIDFGTKLLPVIGNIVAAVLPAVVAFSNWITSGQAAMQVMSVLGPVIAYLGPSFVGLGQAVMHLWTAVQPLLPVLLQVAQVVGRILVVAIGILVNILTFLINVVASVISFFEHNQVAADALAAVLIILGVVAIPIVITIVASLVLAFIAWAIAAGSAAIATLAATWPILLIGAIVALVVTGIILAIQHWGAIVAWFQGLWNAFSHYFMDGLRAIGAFVGTVVASIVSFFQGLWNGIWGAISSIPGKFMDFWNGLKTDAINAGEAIIKGLADAITGAIHFVTDAVTNVTSWISAHLPHSPAKVGPLRDLHAQGMEISNQIAQGMLAGTPLLTGAMNNLTKPVTVGLKGAASTSAPLQGGNQGDTYIQITMDGSDITHRVMKRVQKELRGHGLKK